MTEIIVGAILVLATFAIIKGMWEQKKNYKKDKEAWEKVNPGKVYPYSSSGKDLRFRSSSVPVGWERNKDGIWGPKKTPTKLSDVFSQAIGCLIMIILAIIFYLVLRYVPGSIGPGMI